jgi:hypothetical protein
MNARTVKGSPRESSPSACMTGGFIPRKRRTAARYQPIQAMSKSGWSRHGKQVCCRSL